jgi:hypothetical protein
MKTLFTPRLGWFTLATLLIFSPQLTGCDTDAKSRLTPVSEPLPSPDKFEMESTVSRDQLPKATSIEAKGSSTEALNTEGDVDKKSPVALPEVMRFVIASDVAQREPVTLGNGKVDEPVVAFVEIKNLGETDSKVIVTFEHESGKKVGFISLDVPAEISRYRTWGRTHNIHTPGEWTAIVATESGEELARKSFTVTG